MKHLTRFHPLQAKILSCAAIVSMSLVAAVGSMAVVPSQPVCAQEGEEGPDMECGIACGVAGGQMIRDGDDPKKVRKWIDWCRKTLCGWEHV